MHKNPHFDTQQDDDNPVYCRKCDGYLGQRGNLHPDTATTWNGWWWCPEHAEEMQLLAMDPDQRELAGQEQAARQDIERDDFVDEVNRIRR